MGLLSRGSQVRILPGAPFLTRFRAFRPSHALLRTLLYVEDNPADLQLEALDEALALVAVEIHRNT
jgi:hypothetical protein